MAKIYPFRGWRYAPAKVQMDKVVTQPYDKISKEMQESYYAADPLNIIRIVLGKREAADSAENNVYTRADSYLKEWRRSGALVQLKAPAFIVYFQKSAIPGTHEQRIRKGFIGLGQIEDYEHKVVFPHEQTLSGPKQDRLQLLRHTRTHFEQIFLLYEDANQRIDKILDEFSDGAPDIEVSDEYGVEHTLWIVDRSDVLQQIQEEMSDKKLIIADGHHRYETALAYRNERRAAAASNPDAAYERMPMTFFNMRSPGLTILPTHRIVSGLQDFDSVMMLDRASEWFDLLAAPMDPEAFRSELKKAGETRITLGACMDGGRRNVLLGLKDAVDWRLDVEVLHRLVVEKCLGISEEAVKQESNITYVREFRAALEAVRAGKAQVSFLLNPTRLEQMRDIAYAGQVMPQKSTDFYPKVLSGLMLYSLDE